MSLLAAIDPGEDYAVAWFRDGQLVDVKFRELTRPEGHATAIVVEFPRIYPGTKNPGSILEVAYSAGLLASLIGPGLHVSRVVTVTIPKSEVERRVRNKLSSVEEVVMQHALETVPKGKRNNCYDATRHGLVYLDRMAP